MAKNNDIETIYSTLFHLIESVKFKGWCIHMLCLQGEGFFTLNDHPFCVRKNDAVIINTPQYVRVVGQSEDLQVEILAAPHEFLWNQLPANNFGIGGSINLFNDLVIPLSEEQAEIL